MTDQQLANYATLILWCVESIESQNLLIQSETLHRPLVAAVAEEAYRQGARLVTVDYEEPSLTASRLRHARGDSLAAFADYQRAMVDDLADDSWTRVRITGQVEPDNLAGIDPARIGTYMTAYRTLLEPIRKRFARFEAAWVGVLMPTPALAAKAYPNETADEAYRRYERAIVDVLHLDDDPVSCWKAEFGRLASLREKFNAMKLDSLRFEGPDTDLVIGLHPGGSFMAAEETLPGGRTVRVNMPSCEVFATPDARRTSGRVRVTRPFQSTTAPGQTVEGAWFEFKDGAVIGYGAARGEEILGRVLSMDERARYLGEVALVSADSPVAQQEITFGSMLYDENAACHIALGAGFPRLVPGVMELSTGDQIAAGVNHSMVHDDMMIGGRAVDVTGTTATGEEVPIIRSGLFVV